MKSAGINLPGSSSENDPDAEVEVDDILECLEPHRNLRRLYIEGFPGTKFPIWVLPNLVVLALINCERCKSLPADSFHS